MAPTGEVDHALHGPRTPTKPTNTPATPSRQSHNLPQASQNTPGSARSQLLASQISIGQSPSSLTAMSSLNDESVFDCEHIFPNLQRAMTLESAKDLERCSQIGINIANDLIQRLYPAKHCRDVSHRLKSLEALMQQSVKPQYILGVVGSTGHGKSSLINALLGEDKLVPTNCVRACTAVVTEISWNPSENPRERYVGNIEFISMNEWRYELDNLFSDIALSNDELAGDANNRSTDAGVAWAKIRAIYPHITKEDLAKTNAETLADDPAVSSLLGVTKTVYGATAEKFYKDIRVYVDSKQKLSVVEDQSAGQNNQGNSRTETLQGLADGDFNDSDKQKPAVKKRVMELWPLIKVVRIQTKADMLSTGAIIVDLPGIEDSNAARTAIAGQYLEKCHGIWIVASIQRAMDDKSAQNLLNRSFKQQMQLDGNVSNITFICSKTDDISAEEAAESLGLHHELAEMKRSRLALEKWEASNLEQYDKETAHVKSLVEYIAEVDKRLSQWELVELRHKDGKKVITPLIKDRKRKAPSRSTTNSKRSKTDSPLGEKNDTKYPSVDDLLLQLQNDGPSLAPDQPLDGEHIRSMIEYLRTKKFSILEEKIKLEDKTDDDKDTYEKLREDVSEKERLLETSCIRRRNDYARQAIRNDYALGLKELDQEPSQQDNPEVLDLDEVPRDYNGLANNLPVFCVSSKGYRSLLSQNCNGNLILGFGSPEATEIPQLIVHAKKLTESRRTHACAQFLNGLLQNVISLRLWVTEDEDDTLLTDEEKQAQIDQVKAALVSLEKNICKVSSKFIHVCYQIITDKLFKRLHIAVAKAIKQAPGISEQWPSHRRNDGGLPCISYKATCRRQGVFSGSRGHRDFNEDLIYPLKQELARTWEQSFTKKVPRALEKFTSASEKLLRAFHNDIKSQLQKKTTFTSINALQNQLKSRVDSLTHMARTFKEDVTRLQRESNRGFHPAIMDAMSSTYDACANEAGRGCFHRIQRIMDDDLKSNGQMIFREAAAPVQRGLTDLCEHLKTQLEAKTANIMDGMAKDYTNVIVGRDITKDSKAVRDEASQLLEGLDARFENVLRADGEPPSSGPSAGSITRAKSEPEEDL